MAGIHGGERGSQECHRTGGTGAAELRESPRRGEAASRARLSDDADEADVSRAAKGKRSRG